jgi:hypothetical protein
LVAALPETVVERAIKEGRKSNVVELRDKGPKVDGDLADWPASTGWMTLDGRASAAVLLTKDHLCAAWKTDDPEALSNGGGNFQHLFKQGGALDLMIGGDAKTGRERADPAPGDLRLLITRVKGKTQAVLYRAVVPGTPEAERVEFASPVGKVFFDRVEDVSDKIESANKDGNFEVAIPLALLGLKPERGKEFLADIGILRGDAGRTTQRVYWSNHNTVIVSDLPSEARLQPAQWGVWKVK